MNRLKKLKLKRLFVNKNGDYLEEPLPYDMVKDFMVSMYMFSPNDDTFSIFYETKYVPLFDKKTYMQYMGKPTLKNLFGISLCMISDESYLERGYSIEDVEKMHDTIMSNRNEYIDKRSSTIPPIDDMDVKNLYYDNGRYIRNPKSYEYVKNILITAFGFNPDNDAYIKEFYTHKYIPVIENYGYWELRNTRHFGRIFNVFSDTVYNIKYWIDRGYSSIDAETKIYRIQSKTSLESFIKRYGEECGARKYVEYIKDISAKSSITNKRLHQEGIGYPYSKTINPETGDFYKKSEISDLCIKNSIAGGEAAKLSRDGKPFSVWQKQYWINLGYDEESAREAVKSRMVVNSLPCYIEKYGTVKGVERYNARRSRYINTCNAKTDEEKMEWNKKKIMHIPHGVSRSSMEFFKSIVDALLNDGIKLTYMYGDNEYYIADKEYSTIYFYDFYVKEANMLVEFNGIKFHPNPNKMTPTEIKEWRSLFYNIPGDVQLKKDMRKEHIATELGYNYMVVWEDDNLTATKEQIINKIKDNIC